MRKKDEFKKQLILVVHQHQHDPEEKILITLENTILQDCSVVFQQDKQSKIVSRYLFFFYGFDSSK